jgi:DNA-binding GntR family transcriptional regulator
MTSEELRLQAEFGPLLWLSMATGDGRRRSEADHGAIVDAIAAGAQAQARERTERHLRRTIDEIVRMRLELRDD